MGHISEHRLGDNLTGLLADSGAVHRQLCKIHKIAPSLPCYYCSLKRAVKLCYNLSALQRQGRTGSIARLESVHLDNGENAECV